MDNEWMLWWIFAPVGVDELEDILRDAIEMGGTLGVDQVVLGVHVDAMLGLPSHLLSQSGKQALLSGHFPQMRGRNVCRPDFVAKAFYS